MKGKLYLFPTPLADATPEETLPEHALKTLKELRVFAVENIKTSRRFLRKVDREFPIDDSEFFIWSKKNREASGVPVLESLESGKDVGLMSETGLPAVADPGGAIVMRAQLQGIQVVPFAGPSSITMALMASGLNGQTFTFHGYLPIDRKERIKTIQQMEAVAGKTGYSQIFMDTPFRNDKVLDDLLSKCASSTMLCVAANIGSEKGYVKTTTVGDWKKRIPGLHKIPVIFILGVTANV